MVVGAAATVVTGAATAYITVRLGRRAEHRKWRLELAQAMAEATETSQRLASQLAIGFLKVASESSDDRRRYFIAPYGALTVGRGAECDIVLPDLSVSRMHARFVADRSQVYVQPLGATNGVLVNGTYDVRSPLPSGATIELGGAMLEFFDLHRGRDV